MFPGLKECRIAEMRRQDLLVEVERSRLVRQAAQHAAQDSSLVPGLTATVRYARYLLTSLATVAFGMSVN